MRRARVPKWLWSHVKVRDGNRCVFRVDGRRVCGRTGDLWLEPRHWYPEGVWDPSDHQLVCLYHLSGGFGLHHVDWSTAGRA